jgi:hypothetical protein
MNEFHFRLNSLEYQNLTDKLQGPVRNAENIRIFKSTAERFLEVFRDEVARNQRSKSMKSWKTALEHANHLKCQIGA